MKSERISILEAFYSGIDEGKRLAASRQGQLEYITTMSFIRRLAPPGARILELGAGTGRYSAALAGEGFDVTALELVGKNFEMLRQNCAGLGNVRALQGDALDLGLFRDGEFDMTLSLGPMYHLYDPAHVSRAIDEAVRVTRQGGIIITAFLSVYAILFNNYLRGNLSAGLEENFTPDHRIRHFEEQLFTGYDIREFEALFENRPIRHITTASANSVLELASGRVDFSMSDEEFDLFTRFHLSTCENRELLGSSSHLLHICEKL